MFGLLFFIPFAGWAVGAGMGALFGHFGEKGIDKAFQQQVRDYLQPGTSALFMVIEQATPDKAVAALEKYHGTVTRPRWRRTPKSSRTRCSRPSRCPAAANGCQAISLRARGSSATGVHPAPARWSRNVRVLASGAFPMPGRFHVHLGERARAAIDRVVADLA